MPLDVNGREKIVYKEGDRVSVSIFVMDVSEGEGIIRGRAIENVIDYWIVEIVKGIADPTVYPYSCVSLPHVCLTPIPEESGAKPEGPSV